MKKVLLILLTVPVFALNAQIFINTNPNSKGKTGSVVKETTKVDETKKELETTKTSEEKYTKKVTSPNYDSNTTKTTISGTTVKTSTSTPSSSVKVNTTNVSGTNVSGTNVSGTNVSGTNVSGTRTSGTTTSNTDKTTTTTTNKNYGSSATNDVPPNAQPGKCYARCQTEDQYDYKTKQVINAPKMTKRIKLPALYTTVYDTVVIRPQSSRNETIPAQYETIRQQKMISPTTTKWVKGKADAGCLSANPNDCQVMCLVEIPAQYTTISKRVMKHQAYTRSITVPMEYKIVAKQVRTQNERYAEQVIPATYKTVQERYIIKKGGYQGWREILCGSDLTTAKISAIQRALRAAGYNPGPIDNVFGYQTKEALKKYQRAKGLPVGNLNLETLRSLGV